MRKVVLALLFLSATAYAFDLILVPGVVYFNPVVHSPTTHLPPDDRQEPDTFLDGIASRGISESYPDLQDNTLPQLHRSRCFWMQPGEVNLSWEMVATAEPTDGFADAEDPDPENPTLDVELGACTLTDPVTRRAPIDGDGRPVTLDRRSKLFPGATVEFLECAGTVTNAYNACFPVSTCKVVTGACGMQPSSFPFCGERCRRRVSQGMASFAVRFSGGAQPLRKDFFTTYKVVAAGTTLARPLTPIAVDPSHVRFAWGTSDTDGVWGENFSTQLYVSRVRIFEVDPDGGRRYLVPLGLWIDQFPCSHDASGSASLETCSELGSVTPTNATWKLNRPLTWNVDLAPAEVNPKRFYYIEYVVDDKIRQRPGSEPSLRLLDESLDFGTYDYRATVSRKTILENNGVGDLMLGGVEAPAGFTVSTPGVALDRAFLLKRGESMSLEVVRQPQASPAGSWVEERGQLVVLTGINLERMLVGLDGEAYDYGASTRAFPGSLPFAEGRHSFHVISSGLNPVRVRALHVEGTGAAAFRLASPDPCAKATDPLCLQRVIRSGESTLYRLTPASATCRTTDAHATVRIETEECVTPGLTCAATDDWRRQADLSLPASMLAGFGCP